MPTSDLPEPEVRPDSYRVSFLPADHPWARDLSVLVEHRGKDLWSVRDRAWLVTSSGEYLYTPREQRDHLMPLDTAITVAKRILPDVEVNGVTIHNLPTRP